MEGLVAWPRREGAGPITEPGGRDAGIRARTGASTILMLLLLILLLYLGRIENYYLYTKLKYFVTIILLGVKAANDDS